MDAAAAAPRRRPLAERVRAAALYAAEVVAVAALLRVVVDLLLARSRGRTMVADALYGVAERCLRQERFAVAYRLLKVCFAWDRFFCGPLGERLPVFLADLAVVSRLLQRREEASRFRDMLASLVFLRARSAVHRAGAWWARALGIV